MYSCVRYKLEVSQKGWFLRKHSYRWYNLALNHWEMPRQLQCLKTAFDCEPALPPCPNLSVYCSSSASLSHTCCMRCDLRNPSIHGSISLLGHRGADAYPNKSLCSRVHPCHVTSPICEIIKIRIKKILKTLILVCLSTSSLDEWIIAVQEAISFTWNMPWAPGIIGNPLFLQSPNYHAITWYLNGN